MRLLFVVDGRSPIALNWIRYFVRRGDDVHLVSLYPCHPDLELASLTVLPVAFSGAVEQGQERKGESLWRGWLRKLATPRFRTWLRHRFVPRSLPGAAEQLQSLIDDLQPDLIHAMRIPYEGMVAALADRSPLLVSVWGNDFTLHAPATRKLTRLTRLTLERADALHTDCRRDLELAREWGFEVDKPSLVVPGAGGIQLDVFYPSPSESGAKGGDWMVINPRGLRAYVRNDTFFRAIPLVLAQKPGVRFVCPAMQNQPEAEEWASRLDVGDSLQLLPRLSRTEMAAALRRSKVMLSITEHDGTPNSLLEAMACGCFPIAGDIPSLREWINPGKNGFLVDPGDPDALAEAILRALDDPDLRIQAQKQNARLIAERAEYDQVMAQAADFYAQIISMT
jgi:glycosyltransferase involved in cell wall biosynthesis